MTLRSINKISIFERIHIGPGKAWANICWLFSIIVIVTVVFLLTANFTRREKAIGFLVANPQIIRVNAPRAGRVQQVMVTEGQRVKKGDILLLIDPDPALVNGKPAAQVELENIEAVREEIGKRLGTISAQSKAKQTEISSRIAAVNRQTSALYEGVGLQKRTIELMNDQLKTGAKLANSGSLSVVELQRRETTLQDARLNAQNLVYTLGQNEALLAELKGQLAQIPIEAYVKVSELKQSLAELRQREADAQGRLALQVIASADGIVDTLLTGEGQTIESGSVIISLLPETSILRAELYVPSKAIVFVARDQAVRIAYDAFPYARYGFAEGQIEAVASTVLRSDEIHKPVVPEGPSFRVIVALKQQSMRSDSKNVPLRPGLTLTADIILDRQSLAAWILRSISELWTRI